MKYLRIQQNQIAGIIAEQNHRAYKRSADYEIAVEILDGIKNQFDALFAIDDSTFDAGKFVEKCRRKS